MIYFYDDRDINISFTAETGEKLTGKLRSANSLTGDCIVEANDGRIFFCNYADIKRIQGK